MEERVESRGARSLYRSIRENRAWIMGVALLCVMLYHSWMQFSWGAMRFVQSAGYGGADLFILCSGFSIAHALSTQDARTFYSRRLVRLLPPYWAFLIVFVLYCALTGEGMRWQAAAGNFLCTGWWLGLDQQFNWYVPAIAAFYLISPALYALLRDAKRPRRMLSALILVTAAVSLTTLSRPQQMAAIRLPLYILGMYMGMYLPREKPLTKKALLLCAAGLVAGLALLWIFSTYTPAWMDPYGLWWYPQWLIAPCALTLLAAGADAVGRVRACKPLVWTLKKLGACSFEIYLIHTAVFERILRYVKLNNWGWLAVGVVCIGAGIAMHAVLEAAVSRICAAIAQKREQRGGEAPS